jgi:hypothetical protein
VATALTYCRGQYSDHGRGRGGSHRVVHTSGERFIFPMRSQRFVDNVALTICEGVASPISLGVYLRVKYGEWDELSVMEIRPSDYGSASDYFADRVVVDLVRKDQSLETTVDRRKAAINNFWAAERSCYRANERLAPYLEGVSHPSCDEAIARFLRVCRKNVRRLIGYSIPEDPVGRHGPGSTFGDRGQCATVPDKMQSQPTVNTGGTVWLQQWSLTAWGRTCAAAKREEIVVRGNRYLTVPKDARKDRGIAVEPSINVFYQLALGQVMRRRLKQQGLNLDSAQDVHKQVACEASKEGHLSTIDLSNASDTVCSNLVKLLLPVEWFEALSSLRSSHTLLDDHWVKLEKFSSMGNGYTFELETTIFLAICMAVMETNGVVPDIGTNVLVFGDDIIVPCGISSEVLAALKFLGFTPNVEKTFLSGPFRESCGGDYFLGADVRPHYIKEEVTEPQHFIVLANALWRLRKKVASGRFSDALGKARFKVLDQLPSHIRALRGPECLGDLVIHDDERFWKPRVRHSIREFRAYTPVSRRRVGWKYFSPDVVLASAVYFAGKRQSSKDDLGLEGVTPRDSVSGYKIDWVACS